MLQICIACKWVFTVPSCQPSTNRFSKIRSLGICDNCDWFRNSIASKSSQDCHTFKREASNYVCSRPGGAVTNFSSVHHGHFSLRWCCTPHKGTLSFFLSLELLCVMAAANNATRKEQAAPSAHTFLCASLGVVLRRPPGQTLSTDCTEQALHKQSTFDSS